MSTLQDKLPALLDELTLIHTKGWDPKYCAAKLRAVVENDQEGYCEALEEELAVKTERLTDLERAGDLSAEIVERLRARIQEDEDTIEYLRKENDAFALEFKALNLSRESVAGDLASVCYENRDMDRLVANLEAENKREAARTRAAELQLRRVQHEHAELLKKYEAAEGQLRTLRRATWATDE
jgi:chromosome segregation ATPase